MNENQYRSSQWLKMFGLSVFLFFNVSTSFAETRLPIDVMSRIKDVIDIEREDILYVDFWASWCNPCRNSFPWMNSMVNKYRGEGFKILAINVDKDRALADKFLSSVEARFPILYDPKGELAKEFNLKGMPSSFIINSDGVILKAHKGFFENQTTTYEQEIRSLLQAN